MDEKNRDISRAIDVLTPPIEVFRLMAARSWSVDNLKRMAVAMHNYYDVNKHFPQPASYGKDGKPLLSWRVHILPYLGHSGLYEQFHLDEPWDSPHNRTLIEIMPDVYHLAVSRHKEKGRTNYLLPVGNGAAFSADKPTKISDITDGTSNTIMIVEADDEHAVIWTKPDDWPFDPKDPAKGLGRFFHGGFDTAICDGSVHWLPLPDVLDKLPKLISRAGGEPVSLY